MENKCVLCRGNLVKKVVNYKVYGVSIGKFPALVCDLCGEQWFDEETSKRIEEAEKKAGIFGLSVETKISYSGNSLIIRIPKEMARFMNIKKETRVVIHPEDKDKFCVLIK